jgi:hypothetical protein
MTAPAGTMRITTHPRHHDWVILRFGPELNPLIGTFPPARQALDLGGYILHTTQLPALHTWARHHTIHLLDDTTTSHPTPDSYCHHCGRQIRDGGCCDHPTRLPDEPAADPAAHARAARQALHARPANPTELTP